jgi:hypothetical protein
LSGLSYFLRECRAANTDGTGFSDTEGVSPTKPGLYAHYVFRHESLSINTPDVEFNGIPSQQNEAKSQTDKL